MAAEKDAAPDELARLGAELARLTRRADRLRLQTASEQQDADNTWAAWSQAVSAALDLVDQIGKIEATNLQQLTLKYDALAWRLTYDDALLDRSAGRRIRAFGRELAEFASARR